MRLAGPSCQVPKIKSLQHVGALTTEKSIDIAGLGVSTLDLLTLVEHFPDADHVQPALDSRLQGGGPVATALIAAARLGARTAMIDRIGDDWRGRQITEEFQHYGVDTTQLLRTEGASSSLASIWVRQKDGARSIAYAPGSAPELDTDELPMETIQSAKILHCNGRHWNALPRAAELARSSQTLVSLDGGASRFREPLRDYLGVVDIAIVAEDFAGKCTGKQDVESAAEALLELGPSLAIITSGVKGSYIRSRDQSGFHQPAFLRSDTVDTTGCGDVYHGVFLAGLAWNWPLERCAQLASAAAALNSTALGGRGHLAALPELEAWIKES